MTRFGKILRRTRGPESRLSFARRLKLSYTFVRAMEDGLRFPSDVVLETIAERLNLDVDDLVLAAYCDRSPALATALRERGLDLPADALGLAGGETAEPDGASHAAENVATKDAVGE